MKQFFIVRHAKSSWSDLNLKDIDRPLNKRGIHDAPKMAEYLKEMNDAEIEYIVSSPANRALSTAKIFHGLYEIQSEIDIDLGLYHASTDDLIDIIHQFPEEYSKIAIFGHNPGFTYLVNHFSNGHLDNLPTCGIAQFESNAKTWSQVFPDNCKMMKLLFPKKVIY